MQIDVMMEIPNSTVSESGKVDGGKVQSFYEQWQTTIDRLNHQENENSVKHSLVSSVVEDEHHENEEFEENLEGVSLLVMNQNLSDALVLGVETTLENDFIPVEDVSSKELGELTLYPLAETPESQFLEDVEGLEMSDFPELKWEVEDTPLMESPLENSDEESSFLSEGWSSQTLNQKAEDWGVKAPEGGLSQRLESLLNETSLQSQGIRTSIEMIPTLETPQTEVPWTQREVLMHQMVKHASMMQEGDVSKLSLTLFPRHLGTMQIEFEMVQGVLSGRIVTQSQEVSQWMEKAIDSLASETLSLKTIQVETQVSFNTFSFAQSQQQSEARTFDRKKGRHSYLIPETEMLDDSNTLMDENLRLIL